MSRPHRALVVGASPGALEVIRPTLQAQGHDLTRVRTLVEAERELSHHAFCYALIGCELEPHAQGIATFATSLSLLHRVRRSYLPQALPVAVIGSLAEAGQHFGRLVWAGCTEFLTVPLVPADLDQRICAASLICEARRAACSVLPSPPLAGQRLYGVERAVHFAGVSKRKRFLLTVDDEELYLPRSLFEGLLELALALLDDPDRYTSRQRLFGDNPHTAISRLRRKLTEVGVEPCLQQDHQGGVRLSVPPDRLTFASELLHEEFPQLARFRAAKAVQQ